MVELANKSKCRICISKAWDGYKYVCDKTQFALSNTKDPCPPRPVIGNKNIKVANEPSPELILRKQMGR